MAGNEDDRDPYPSLIPSVVFSSFYRQLVAATICPVFEVGLFLPRSWAIFDLSRIIFDLSRIIFVLSLAINVSQIEAVVRFLKLALFCPKFRPFLP